MEAFEITRDIDICVVDDHHIFRKALAGLISTFPRIRSVTEAENGSKCLQVVAQKNPHLVLLDLEMPVMNGIDCAEKLLQKYPDIKVIILTMHDSEKYMLHMIEMGVHSFLLKNSEPDELERAICSVVDKDYYHNEMLVSVLRKSMQNKIKSRRPDFSQPSPLTDREQRVLELMFEEKSAKEIARVLSISEKTVHSHKLNIQHKLQVKTTVGMIRAAYELGLLK
jgi:two-component system, NarL family, response regulator DegU